MFLQFQTGHVGYQFEQQIPWVQALGISVHVGVDGVNVGIILMAANRLLHRRLRLLGD